MTRLCLVVLALLPTFGVAQFQPGDFVVSDFFPTDGISRIDASNGSITTLLPAGPSFSQYDAIAIGPRNDHAVLLRSDGVVMRLAPTGAATTILTWPKPASPQGAIIVDQDGSLVIAADQVLRRVRGGAVVATIATGAPLITGMARDTATGGFVASDAVGRITRISRAGVITTLTTFPRIFVTLDIDQRDGHYWAAYVGRAQFAGEAALFDGGTGVALTTITRPLLDAITVDRPTGDLIAATGDTISRITRNNITVRTWGPYPGYRFNELAVWGSRKVTGDGSAAPGSRHTAHIRMPNSPSASCCSALSFTGARPGIAIGGQTLHIALDGLFLATACGALPGFTTGFATRLDATGAATATWVIPSFIPTGTRYTFVAVALNPGLPDGIDASGALTVVVE